MLPSVKHKNPITADSSLDSKRYDTSNCKSLRHARGEEKDGSCGREIDYGALFFVCSLFSVQSYFLFPISYLFTNVPASTFPYKPERSERSERSKRYSVGNLLLTKWKTLPKVRNDWVQRFQAFICKQVGVSTLSVDTYFSAILMLGYLTLPYLTFYLPANIVRCVICTVLL